MIAVDGYSNFTNVTFAYFNDICGRRDIAIQIGQHNDNGAFPVHTSLMSLYNTAQTNIIFNGRPNLGVINPTNCVGEFILKKKISIYLLK